MIVTIHDNNRSDLNFDLNFFVVIKQTLLLEVQTIQLIELFIRNALHALPPLIRTPIGKKHFLNSQKIFCEMKGKDGR
jgi:hypothetical protein